MKTKKDMVDDVLDIYLKLIESAEDWSAIDAVIDKRNALLKSVGASENCLFRNLNEQQLRTLASGLNDMYDELYNN